MGKEIRERKLTCPDCMLPMRLRGKSRMKYICLGCNASLISNQYGQPLGHPATKEVRHLRRHAHIVFDQLWKSNTFTRSAAQRWLAKQLGISTRQCHFGYMSRNRLKKVIRICESAENGDVVGPIQADDDPIASKRRQAANKAVQLLRRAGAHPSALRYWVGHQVAVDEFNNVGGLTGPDCVKLVTRIERVFAGGVKGPRGVKVDRRLMLTALPKLRRLLRELEEK